MIFPGVLAQQALLGAGGGVPWTPLNLAAVPQIYLNAQDSVVTNVSGACSAISNLGAMGANGDFSQGTAAYRPTILDGELNGRRVLRFDGVDDVLAGSSVAQRELLRSVGAGWCFMVLRKRALDAPATTNRLMFNYPKGTTGAARFRVSLTTGAAGTENRATMQVTRLDSGATANMSVPASPGTTYSMLLVHMNYATGRGDIYVDGTLAASNTALLDTGITSSTASFTGLTIGAGSIGGALATDADLAAMIVDRSALSGTDIDRVFGWAAHEYGLAANLDGTHPYKHSAPAS